MRAAVFRATALLLGCCSALLAPLHSNTQTDARRGPGVPLHRNTVLDAPNVWQVPMAAAALDEARAVFDEALMPHMRAGLIDELETRPVPCTSLHTERGRFFVMRGGSSTNQELRSSSDLAWISVDDERSFSAFAEIFAQTGLADAVRPLVDHDDSVVLYSSFYVVRSRCAAPNLHADWPDAVGTNAFTLLTPLDNYASEDFQLLFETWGAEPGERAAGLHRYRYKTGEALIFGSHFMHSTEPGRSADGGPQVYLCFTFGSDKARHWPAIAPTISGYQSRFLSDHEGQMRLTELGRFIDEGGIEEEERLAAAGSGGPVA